MNLTSGYQTLFEFTQKHFPWLDILGFFVFLPLGILLVRYAPRIRPRMFAKPVGWLMIIFSLFATITIVGGRWSDYEECLSAYREGKCPVVEGIVKDLGREPGRGPTECFHVNDVHFCYSEFEASTGYNRSSENGGIIRDGLAVRITYYEGKILRIEVPESGSGRTMVTNPSVFTGSLPMDGKAHPDGMLLGFLFAALIVSAWWNLDWRHVGLYWFKTTIPTTAERTFRLLLLLTFVGGSISLVRFVSVHVLEVKDVVEAIRSAIPLLAFCLVSDVVYRVSEWQKRTHNRQTDTSPYAVPDKPK